MGYNTLFPGMTKFQREFGAKGVTGASGIIPYNKNKPVQNLRPKAERKKFGIF